MLFESSWLSCRSISGIVHFCWRYHENIQYLGALHPLIVKKSELEFHERSDALLLLNSQAEIAFERFKSEVIFDSIHQHEWQYCDKKSYPL